MNVNGVRRLMRLRIAKFPSQAEWARSIGENPSAVSMMLTMRDPSSKVLDALDLEKAPTEYRRKAANVKGKSNG